MILGCAGGGYHHDPLADTPTLARPAHCAAARSEHTQLNDSMIKPDTCQCMFRYFHYSTKTISFSRAKIQNPSEADFLFWFFFYKKFHASSVLIKSAWKAWGCESHLGLSGSSLGPSGSIFCICLTNKQTGRLTGHYDLFGCFRSQNIVFPKCICPPQQGLDRAAWVLWSLSSCPGVRWAGLAGLGGNTW